MEIVVVCSNEPIRFLVAPPYKARWIENSLDDLGVKLVFKGAGIYEVQTPARSTVYTVTIKVYGRRLPGHRIQVEVLAWEVSPDGSIISKKHEQTTEHVS